MGGRGGEEGEGEGVGGGREVESILQVPRFYPGGKPLLFTSRCNRKSFSAGI